jgi:acetyl-CoA carboxylase biotin carboxyl carrier protein
MTSTGPGDVFDVKKIRRLVQLMKDHDLSEIDLEQGEQRIRLRRGAEGIGAPVAAVAPPVSASPAAAAASGEGGAATEEDGNLVLIKSPMVGTFYSASSPDAASYVKVGDHIGAGTTVCIVEAMKVFNEIPAEVSGKIVAVLVENGDPIEYGQPLFKVDVSA